MHMNFPGYSSLESEIKSSPFSASRKPGFEYYGSIYPVFKPLPHLGVSLIDAVFLHHRICDGLHCFYAIRHDDGHEIVHQGHLEAWGIKKNELYGIAMDNMRKFVVGNLEVHGDGEGMVFIMNGEFEAGLLMIDEIWEQVEEQIGDEIVVSAPTRGILVARGKSGFNLSDPLVLVVKGIFKESDAQLSDKWFTRVENNWVVFATE